MEPNSPLFYYAIFYATFVIGGFLAGITVVSRNRGIGYWTSYGTLLIAFSAIGWMMKTL